MITRTIKFGKDGKALPANYVGDYHFRSPIVLHDGQTYIGKTCREIMEESNRISRENIAKEKR